MKIAIDPGHGMSNRRPGVYDPGACRKADGIFYREAEIAMAYGNTLAWLCFQANIPIWLSRRSEIDPCPVGQRAPRAAAAGCTHLVSLHLNSFILPGANGIEVLWRTPQSQNLARALQSRLVVVTGRRDRGIVERHDLAVLDFKPGPAVLVEFGFISNAADRGYLLLRDNRIAICAAIVDVLKELEP